MDQESLTAIIVNNLVKGAGGKHHYPAYLHGYDMPPIDIE
jgi:hypothetical protein